MSDQQTQTTLATKIGEESELYKQFEQFEEETGYRNRSKALRAALRRGLDEGNDSFSNTEWLLLAVLGTQMAVLVALVGVLEVAGGVGAFIQLGVALSVAVAGISALMALSSGVKA